MGVNLELIFGAVSAYLLLGVAWGFLHTLVELLQPGAYLVPRELNPDGILNNADFLYFSFTTLTTLGYGDITPVTSQARSMVILEAVTGVFYLAVLISRLIGLYQPNPRTDPPES